MSVVAAVDTAYVFSRLLLSLCIVLVLGRGAAIVCRRIGLPVVIGELIVGVALGPSLLGLISPSLREDIFPADVLPFLNVVSQLGIVLFMFLVGLELDLDVVRKSGRRAVGISLTSIAVPFLLGVLVLGTWLHPAHDCVPVRDAAITVDADEVCEPSPGQVVDDGDVLGYREVERLGFSLFIGVSICGTAFAILARILAERKMFRIPLGLTLVACAAVDDIVAFTLLAVVLSVAAGASLTGVAQTLALLAIFTVVLFVVIRPLLRRFLLEPFQRAGRLLPEHLAVVFIGLFASAFYTHVIGVNTIIGAFLFGAAIPRHSEQSILDDIAERLDGISVTLLLPVFFVITGQNVRINELRSSDIVPALVIVLVASLGKFVGGSVSARISGVPRRQSLAVGTLMNTRGLAELVILQLGRSLGILDDRMFTMLVVMAVVTTTITPFILRIVYPDRWLARDIAEAERRRSSATTERVTVVVPHGTRVADDAAFTHAVDLAVAYGAARSSATVTLLQMVPNDEGFGAVAEVMSSMRAAQQRVEASGPVCQVIARGAVDLDAAVLAEVGRLAPDLVVLLDDHLAIPIADGGSDVAVVHAERSVIDLRDGLGVRTAGGNAEAAALELAARLALHRGTVLAVPDVSGRARRELGRLGVRTDAPTTTAVIADASTGAVDDVPTVLTVLPGHRDREPLRERLRTWEDVAPVVPLTTL